MAAFPDVRYDWTDLQLAPEAVVERSEVERGIPKQRRIASDARVEVDITVRHDTKTEALAFEDWFYTTINAGQDWFDLTHPVTGAVVQARVVGGQLGPLKFEQRTLQASYRTLKIEYWRAAW